MKQIKLFLTVGLFVFSFSMFASNDKPIKQEIASDLMCCVGEAHDGVEGTAGYIKISVKKCATVPVGGNRGSAYASDCENANVAAQKAVNAMKKMTFEITRPY